MRSVKIGTDEYHQIKSLAKTRGQFIIFVLNEAIRFYLEQIPGGLQKATKEIQADLKRRKRANGRRGAEGQK